MLHKEAKLIKLKTEDGLFQLREGILLGTEYTIDVETKRIINGYNWVQKKAWTREMVLVITGVNAGLWFPTELLTWEGKVEKH